MFDVSIGSSISKRLLISNFDIKDATSKDAMRQKRKENQSGKEMFISFHFGLFELLDCSVLKNAWNSKLPEKSLRRDFPFLKI